jgi:ferrous iron transport protein A
MTLDSLKAGQTATITAVHSTDAERRRLLDLGILPGTKIENVMPSPLGDPVAYRVRNSVVALRREQAALIEIEENFGKE